VSAAFTRDDAWDCDVLVVGGGLVGLAASMFPAQQGLRVWVVERHASTSSHPKLRGVSARTMELYRSAGIEEAVRAAGENHFGVAIGDTEMVDWRIVKRGEGDAPILVEPDQTYLMKPGDSHLYDVGAVHSPNRRGLTKLVRIEGKNLDHVKRSNIKAA